MSDAIDFSSRCVIVTGAGHGLGRAFAIELARRRASMVVNDVGTDERGRRLVDVVAEEIDDAGGSVEAVHASVADVEGAAAIVDTAIRRFGRLDVLINNAGVVLQAPFATLTTENLDHTLAVNLRGAILVAQRAFAKMSEGGYGRIVSISSGAGLFGVSGLAAYACTKAALVGLTATAALEGASSGVRANTVLPYAITNPGRTRLDWPPEDVAQVAPRSTPDFVAPLVAYLASDACQVTGATYSALGGRYARVGVGIGRGWISPGSLPPRPEVIGAHLAEIDQLVDPQWPDSFGAELSAVALQLRRRG